MNWKEKAFIVYCILLVLAHFAFSAERFTFFSVTGDSVKLAWSANTETDLKGYTIYYQTAAGQKMVWAEMDTTISIKVSLAYYWEKVPFWMTAKDLANNESAPSDTISTILCKEGPRLVGDMDGNIKVNLIDKMLFFVSSGSSRGGLRFSEKADLNGDGAVNLIDKMLLNRNAGVK